ncbi:hypothetical protein RvY_07095 [Ramazzottius varieornatus]|uniref:Uncharacterized protein n=1 Tax=Ramazzottius varieornatus TaxID=947166 RepID=A0A1D1V0V0_RAMVA|nr:hypothetical protein RvY_07085 [Ramazzottius varieornatus]GAU95484.1 hypothetical protein RvY_07095 [Ramazzottius varieornatus]
MLGQIAGLLSDNHFAANERGVHRANPAASPAFKRWTAFPTMAGLLNRRDQLQYESAITHLPSSGILRHLPRDLEFPSEENGLYAIGQCQLEDTNISLAKEDD